MGAFHSVDHFRCLWEYVLSFLGSVFQCRPAIALFCLLLHLLGGITTPPIKSYNSANLAILDFADRNEWIHFAHDATFSRCLVDLDSCDLGRLPNTAGDNSEFIF